MFISSEAAINLLNTGHVVSLPTETVYGLAARLDRPEAIEKIFQLKGRPLHNPLIIHLANSQQINHYVISSVPHFTELAAAFWPGPLTLILPIDTEKVPVIVRAHLPTAAFRVPAHEGTCKIIEATGPLVMPSANLSGSPSATSPTHVAKDFGDNLPVVDGGSCQKGLESTILFYLKTEWVIVRRGALTPENLENILGYRPQYFYTSAQQTTPLSPGQLLRHYAPQAKLILSLSTLPHETQFVLGFEERVYPKHCEVIYLGSLLDANAVAANLYHHLRELDLRKIQSVWVDMNFPREGIWQTIADRLNRASQSN